MKKPTGGARGRKRAQLDIPEEEREEARQGRMPSILIVDDEPQMLRMVVTLFEEQLPGVRVHTATDGLQATTKLFQLKPDLLITDILLPGPSGTELTQIAKTEGRLRGTKVIAITGHGSTSAKRSAMASGADAFLAKPFEGEDLVKLARKLLPGSGEAEEEEELEEERFEDLGVEELGEGPEPPEIKSEDEEAPY